MRDRSSPQFFVAVRAPNNPQSTVRVDANRLLSLSFEDTEAKADKLSLAVDNYDLSQLDSPLWQPGNIVEFSFGYPGAMGPAREMKIQTVKGFNPLMIEALGDEVVFNRKPRTDRHWDSVRRSEVVKEIAAEYGYRAERLHVTDTKHMVDVTQGGMTDLQLIKSMAWREGYEFYLDFDGLHFHPRNLKQRPLREIEYFTDRTGDILSISFEDSRVPGSAGKVNVAGRDPMTKQRIAVSADDRSTPRTVLAAERARYAPEDVQSDGSLASSVGHSVVLPAPGVTEEEARRYADGLFKRLDLRAVEVTIQIVGDPMLLAKSLVSLKGIGARYSGTYYVISAKHDLSAGYTTTAKLRREGHASGVGEGALQSTTKPTEQPTNKQTAPPAEADVPTTETRFVTDERTGERRQIQVTTHGRSSGT